MSEVKIVRKSLIQELEDDTEILFRALEHKINGTKVKNLITEQEIFEQLYNIRKLIRNL